MKIKKKALLYDISNIAFTIADSGDPAQHSLHRVRDICQEGNIDRVSRILGLAYAHILSILFPVLKPPCFNLQRDFSATPHNYQLIFRDDTRMKQSLSEVKRFKLKELCHEYMVCMVLADWLAVTLPEAAEVWKFRAEAAFSALKESVAEIMSSVFSSSGLRRKIYPF